MPQEFANLSFGTQVRKSPFTDAALRWGATGLSVYNHMYIPRDFGDPVENFWHLVNDAILCDVAVERQVEITGPDAAAFTQLLCPRDLSTCEVGQCKYVILVDQHGGVINDPILLKLADDHFWLSIADSDVILWAKGVAAHSGMDVHITEPDVSPLQLQGPKSRDILCAAFGDDLADLRYYRFVEREWEGIPLVISRTGWSSELGYEIFLRDGSQGDTLWEHIMSVGEPMGLFPGHTSSIRRIEGAMLSYQADMDLSVNPLELGMDRLLDLDMDADFIGKQALRKIRDTGVSRRFVGLEIDGSPIEGSNAENWPILGVDGAADGNIVGYITSAVYSPRLEKNISLAIVGAASADIGTTLEVRMNNEKRSCVVVPKPFYDPKKQLASKG